MRISDWSSDVCSSDLYDIEFPSVVGFLAPSKTPPAVLEKLNRVLTEIVKSGEFKEFMEKSSQPVRYMDGNEFRKTIERNLVAYRALAKEIGRASCRERVSQSV